MTDTLLHSRSNSGLTVELHTGHGKFAITVIDGNELPITFGVEPENASDAFFHPFIYMPDADRRFLNESKRIAKLEDSLLAV